MSYCVISNNFNCKYLTRQAVIGQSLSQINCKIYVVMALGGFLQH